MQQRHLSKLAALRVRFACCNIVATIKLLKGARFSNGSVISKREQRTTYLKSGYLRTRHCIGTAQPGQELLLRPDFVKDGLEIAAIKFESECSQMMTAGTSQEMTIEPESGSLAFDFPPSPAELVDRTGEAIGKIVFQKRVATGLLILAGIFVSSWTAAVGCVFGHAQTMSLTNNGKFRAANLQWIPAIGKRRFRFHAGHRGRSDSCRILVGITIV